MRDMKINSLASTIRRSRTCQPRIFLLQRATSVARFALTRLSPLLLAALLAFTGLSANAATFNVINTNDSGPGSLRQAIDDANTTAGADTINFNIPGSGVRTIAPTAALPDITEAVTIDGYTQTGSSPNTLAVGVGDNAVILIELDGTAGSCLNVTDGAAVIRGLVINRCSGAGIGLAGSGGSKVEGCFIGIDAGGTQDLANGNGIAVNSPNNTVGGTTPAQRNIISSNDNFGQIWLVAGTGNLVQGNYLGTNKNGTAAIGGGGGGVAVYGSAGVTVGGTSVEARNVISGNADAGVLLVSTAPCVVQGNFIGTNAAGTAALGNNIDGIRMSASNNLIAGNVISGNNGDGVLIAGGSNNTVQGNLIGTNAEGTAPIGNEQAGVELSADDNTLLGGTTAAARNVISGNRYGVFLQGSGIRNVQGNFIGTKADGISALGNTEDGVFVNNGSNQNIGGTAPDAGNVIAFNGINATQSGNGVVVVGNATGIAIQGNSIHGNGKLGIDLGQFTGVVTPNDLGDADTGANNLQNFPVLTSVSTAAGSTTIAGTLNSIPNKAYRIEFFSNGAIDPAGHGEGAFFLGFTNVSTLDNGNASFSAPVLEVPKGRRVTATATDPDGNTSEFSAAIGQLLNIATRLRVQTGDNVLIGGFIVTGTDPKKVLARGIGPSLAAFFPDFLRDPTLELFQGNTLLATNDDWKTRPDGSSQQAEIEATTIPPTNNLESALVRTLPAGNAGYTAIVRGKNNTTGIGVVEVYDLDTTVDSKLANISTRGLVETGNNVLIGGFIPGLGVTKVMVRAIGPTLVNAGVANPLQDPTLQLLNASGTALATNDNWKIKSDGTSQQAEIEATTIPPNDDRESAIVASLPPGNYTAVVRGVNNTIGIAVVEVYNIQ